MDDLGVPLFLETPISGGGHLQQFSPQSPPESFWCIPNRIPDVQAVLACTKKPPGSFFSTDKIQQKHPMRNNYLRVGGGTTNSRSYHVKK